MSRQRNYIHDKYWPEEQINSYAIFMGYLLMGVRGLGLLVLTWTTVVLLGGFVSMLQKEDFWCLTAITLVQTAGVFDFLLKEKASDVGNSLKGLVLAGRIVVMRPFKKDANKKPSTARMVLAVILLVVQVLVFALILCPLVILYVLGLYLSAGISLWRLIQHDYGNPDGGANLKPALSVLYSLAVAQGVLYGYRTIYHLAARTGLVKGVAYKYSLETGLVSEYLEEIMEGCMKDPSFARGRNLITYAVDLLMESKSRHGYICGVLILGRLITHHNTTLFFSRGQTVLIKQLLARSASFSHVVQQLVETFGPTSPYSTEIRLRAASIVGNVAGSVRLDHFPAQGMMMIQSVSSLLDTFQEYSWRPKGYDVRSRRRWYIDLKEEYERSWLLGDREIGYVSIDKIQRLEPADSKTQAYKGLVVQGLSILQELAVDEANCRVICNTQGLLSKAMAHLISDRLHSDDNHDEWSSMAQESLELMKRFMATLSPPGETEATKLPSEISGNIQAIISTLKGILECVRCQVLLKRQAVQVLLDLSVDTHTPASIMPGGSSRSSSTPLVWILLHISLMPDYHFDWMCGATHLAKESSDIARLAEKKLHAMLSSSSQTEPSATTTMQSVGDVICSLATAVSDAKNNTYIRVHAATILKHMVNHYGYTMDDENLKQLKKAMTDVMPKVLKEIVHGHDMIEAGTQAETEENNGCKVLLAAGADPEQGGVSHDNGQESSSTHQQKGEKHQGIQLQEALINLCWEIYHDWIPTDKDLTYQFNQMCSGQGMPHKTFAKLVAKARGNLIRKRRETANSSSET